ncbi:MAG: CsgG/HfaB family protein [Candidatus Marinimicrobia bacterium]|nr:CsgG/HfaB family protein [Candidatus Neomarinimicrobiota bacterium]|tara:strand:+ start:8612 stop:9895 length:1284 start_codon:yes stop_codon:yes gene_type:complete
MDDYLKRIIVLFVAICQFLLTGCAMFTAYGQLERSARDSYQRGDYDEAVYDCAQSLRINPSYEKAQLLIQDAFRAAVIDHETTLGQLHNSEDKFRWDRIVSEYEALERLNRVIKQLPILRLEGRSEIIEFDVKHYFDPLEEAKQIAAEVHYNEGVTYSSLEGIDNKKKAAKEFKTSLRFVAGFKDSAEKYETMRLEAILRIAIIPFEDKSGKRRKYGAVNETIVDMVISDVLNDPAATEFLEIVSRDQLDRVMREQALAQSGVIDAQMAVDVGKILGVHEIVTGKITQIIVTPERTTEDTYKESRRVIIRKERYVNDEGKEKMRDIKGEVTANVKIYKRSTAATIRGSYNIIDVQTARILQSESFSGEASIEKDWATFAGDERALSWRSKQLTGRREQLVPVADEMVSRAANNLAKSLSASLRQYAR